jgi:hypothetical protein
MEGDPEILIEFLEPMRPGGRLWPLRPRIGGDELLSSWLRRVTVTYGIAPRAFRSVVPLAPCNHAFDDLDLAMPAAGLAALAGVSGHYFAELAGAMLIPPAGHLIVRDDHNVQAALARAGGMLLRDPEQGRWPVLQFCPRCLEEHPNLGFRKDWRLAHVCACPEHGLRLLDRCPDCDAWIDPLSGRTVAHDQLCHQCAYPFRLAPVEPATKQVLVTQARLAALFDFVVNRDAPGMELEKLATRVRALSARTRVPAGGLNLARMPVAPRARLFAELSVELLVAAIVGGGGCPRDCWHRAILRGRKPETLFNNIEALRKAGRNPGGFGVEDLVEPIPSDVDDPRKRVRRGTGSSPKQPTGTEGGRLDRFRSPVGR